MPTPKLIANHIKTVNNELDRAKQENTNNLKQKLGIERSGFREE
jgi:hypothetical protein